MEAQIILMKKFTIEEMLENLAKISKENSINLIKKNFEPKDEEISITSSELTFECPLSKSTIEIPVRSCFCTHLNCFDGKKYFIFIFFFLFFFRLFNQEILFLL
jgi:E3 SUMO-protein ligase PIAS1